MHLCKEKVILRRIISQKCRRFAKKGGRNELQIIF